jgi:hypothetical protein
MSEMNDNVNGETSQAVKTVLPAVVYKFQAFLLNPVKKNK